MDKAKIMIVEDEALVAKELEYSLEGMGYAVTSSVSFGEEAVAKVAEDRPDIVLMDILLEGQMDGIEAASLIRSRFEIPVVFLTSYADQNKLDRDKAIEPFGYILKPYQDRDLKVTIEMALYKAEIDTERMQTEEALKESEERFRLLYEQAPLSYQSLDENGHFIEVNRAWLDTLGYTKEEVIGKSFADFLHPDWVEHFEVNFPRFKAVGEVLGVEFEMVKKDGSHILISLNGKIGYDKEGRFKQTHCIFYDITQQRLAEEALKESRKELTIRNRVAEIFLSKPDDEMYAEVLQTILESMESRDGVFGYINEHGDMVSPSMTRDIWDQCQIPEKAIVFPRDTWGGIWGRAMIEKKSMYSNRSLRVPEGHIPIQRAMAVPIVHQGELAGVITIANKSTDYEEKDKELLETIADHIAPVLHARLHKEREEKERKLAEKALRKAHDELEQRDKERTSELVTANERLKQEIGERKKIEGKLRQSEKKYKTLTESSLTGVFIHQDEKFVFFNDRFAEIHGYTPEELLGEEYLTLIHPDERGAAAQKVSKRLKKEPAIQQYEVQRLRKDGTTAWCEMMATAIDYRGRPAVMGNIIDITERKQAEEALKLSGDKLIKEHSQRIILSKKLIDLLEKDRHETAMELHDHIGQILTSLKLNLEMIGYKFKHIDAEVEALIKAAEVKAIQAIKDIKSISKGLKPSMLDTLGLLSSLREMFNEVQKHHDIKIKFFYRNIPNRFAQAKELAVYRIIQEALTNILKHAKAKTVFVNLLKKGNGLSLSVEDDGIGFDHAKAMKISKGKGPLGLVIMRERAIQLGGKWNIEAQIGKGTHMFAEIPL